jgi:hypothetical protein
LGRWKSEFDLNNVLRGREMVNVSGIDSEGNMRMIGVEEGTKEEIETVLKEKGWSVLAIWETEN